jgi:hypothetical protein
MPNQSDSHDDLTPEGAEVLKGIVDDTKALRELDLGDTPQAAVFEAE